MREWICKTFSTKKFRSFGERLPAPRQGISGADLQDLVCEKKEKPPFSITDREDRTEYVKREVSEMRERRIPLFPMEGREGGFDAVGLAVWNFTFGDGTVTACEEGTITVAFGEKHYIFAYPWCFERWSMTFADEEKQAWIRALVESEEAKTYREARRGRSGFDSDPIEDTAPYRRVAQRAEAEAQERAGKGGYMGYCHRYWGEKCRVLLEKYGIVWHSPSAMNPDVMFD